MRTHKGFKEVYLNTFAKLVFEFSGREVTSTQVYNQLRNGEPGVDPCFNALSP